MPELETHEHFLNYIKSGEDALQSRVRYYDRAYEVWRQPEIDRKKTGKKWESILQIKHGMQVVDTALVNLIGGPPTASVKPRRPQDQASAPKMRTVLNYYAREDHLVEKLPTFVQQGLIYGVTAAKNQWLYREVTKPIRKFFSVGGVDLELETEEKVVLRDGPTFEPWDIYAMGWDPNSRDVDSAPYIFLYSWMSRDEIELNTIRESNPYGMFDEAAAALLLEEGPDGAGDTAMSAQERMNRGQQDKRKERYRITEIWRETPNGLYQTILGGKRVVLRDRPTPYAHGKKPVVITQVRPDLFELQGIAETELLDHLQQAMNSLLNMRIDNMHLTVQRGFTYRESGISDPKSLVLTPRFMWPVTDHDDINPVAVQPLPPEAYHEDEVLLARMQLITGINPYISGSDTAGVDQNTATGVTALQEVASRLLRFKARQINYKGLKRTFEQWGDLTQQFMSRAEAIRIQGEAPDTYDWAVATPQEIVGNYDYDIEGTEESLSKQQERGDILQFMQACQPFAQAGMINMEGLLKKLGDAFDIDPALLRPAPQPQAPPAAPGPPGQQGPPQPGQPPREELAQLLNGQPMTPAVSGAMNGGQ